MNAATIAKNLKENPKLISLQVIDIKIADDETIRIRFQQGHIAVCIPSKDDKWALCISSQVGCPVGCKFCYTGKFKQNLSEQELLDQFDAATICIGKEPTSIVCMGMGEPMFNFRNVDAFLKTINQTKGMSFKHMTLSTSGFYLERLIDVPYHVALSLHTPFDKVRADLMPVTKTVAELVEFAHEYSNKHKFGLMVAYALMKGVNDRDEDMAELLKIKWPKNVFFNVIEYNNKGEFTKSPRLVEFKEAIRNAGYKCFIRHSRGADIGAACGMLETPINAEDAPQLSQ